MQEAISFRSLAESLSIQEFNQFTNTLFNTFNQRELLTKSIFHLLAYQNRNTLNTKYTQNINKILINIIHSRNNNDTKDEQDEDEDDDINIKPIQNKTSISDIPYPLIAECSSYLNTKEVIKFEICSRHIYISCTKNVKSMTAWISADGLYGWFQKYMNNNFGSIQSRIKHLSQFNMVKDLKLSPASFKIITNNNKNPENFVWKNINKLRLGSFGGFEGDSYGSWLKANANILKSQRKLEYLELNMYNVTNISHLLSLLSINEHIKFINLALGGQIIRLSPENRSTQYEIIHKFDFLKHMKNLRGLSMHDVLHADDTVFFNGMLSKLFGQLQSYHITSRGSFSSIMGGAGNSIWNEFGGNYKLHNLKEICIYIRKRSVNNGSCDLLTNLLLNGTLNKCNLERLNISLSCGPRVFFTNDEYSKFITFIQHLFDTKKTLKYLSVSGDDATILNAICSYIDNKLQLNNNNPIFESIKFRFLRWKILSINDNRQNIENAVFRLMDVVSKSVSSDFLIKCALPWRPKGRFDANDFDETNYLQCIQRFENLTDIYNVDKTMDITGNRALTYIVTNKKANFYGGYHEQWDMNCTACN